MLKHRKWQRMDAFATAVHCARDMPIVPWWKVCDVRDSMLHKLVRLGPLGIPVGMESVTSLQSILVCLCYTRLPTPSLRTGRGMNDRLFLLILTINCLIGWSVRQSVCDYLTSLATCLSAPPRIRPSIRPFIHSFIHPSIHLLFFCPCINPIYLSVCLSVCRSVDRSLEAHIMKFMLRLYPNTCGVSCCKRPRVTWRGGKSEYRWHSRGHIIVV